MQRYWRKLVLFLCSFILCFGLNQALSIDAAQLVEQGIEHYQAGEFKSAIDLWQTALPEYQKDHENRAIVLENIARAYQQLGQPEIDYWQQAIALNRQLGDSKQVARLLTEAAQTYSRLGQPKTAIALLCNANQFGSCTSESALSLARRTNDRLTEASALGSLGEAYRLIGNYKRMAYTFRCAISRFEPWS